VRPRSNKLVAHSLPGSYIRPVAVPRNVYLTSAPLQLLAGLPELDIRLDFDLSPVSYACFSKLFQQVSLTLKPDI